MKKATGSFSNLKTRSKANQGAPMHVVDAEGNKTEHTIHVRGVDSDAFQQAMRETQTQLLSYLEKNGTAAKSTPEYLQFTLECRRKQQAALVVEWSFDEPCTKENVLDLFTEAPDVAEQVDRFAGDRGKFASVVLKI